MSILLIKKIGTSFVVVCLVFNYLCIAAIARHLYMRPGAGVGSLRDAFGSKHRNGVRHAYHDHVMNYTIVELSNRLMVTSFVTAFITLKRWVLLNKLLMGKLNYMITNL